MSESRQIRLNELCSWLWGGAEILRGPVEHADFKTYLFPIFFLKRINDVWEEERQSAMNEVGADFPENHRFHIPEGARWSDIRSASTNVGQILQFSMRQIEASNPNLEGIFGDAQWTNKERFTDERLKDIIEHFSRHNLGRDVSDDDLVGQVYEWAIKKFADLENKAAGEFYTPRSVIRLMINVINPDEGMSIYDPACGTGGMLLETVRYIRDRGGDIRSLFGKLYGQEKNFITCSMAKANLYLHGLEDFTISRGDTLSNPAFTDADSLKEFDVVIANPPFGLENWGYEFWQNDRWGRNAYGIPPESSGDYAWVQHMLNSVNSTGKVALILPQGPLFRSGAEAKIRTKIVQEDFVESVVLLASNLFYGTTISASILFLNKNKPNDRKEKILMIDGSGLYTRMKAQNEMKSKHIEKILDTVNSYSEGPGFSRVVGLSEILENNANLDVSTYVLPSTVEIPTVTEQFKALQSNLIENQKNNVRFVNHFNERGGRNK